MDEQNPVLGKDAASDANLENRPYQDEMVDRALRENIICALGTGMGKNEVAVSVIKRLQYEIEPAWSEGGKRTVMVVPSVPLVEQQTKYIQKWMPCKVKGYHGSGSVVSAKEGVKDDAVTAAWTKEDWDAELEETRILVMVHDILKDILHHDLIDVARINLLIFDECHHAVGDHSYREIRRCIQTRAEWDRPRLLGLTASVINCKIGNGAEEMECLIKDLENCLGAKVCTSIDESMKKHEALPTVSLDVFKDTQPDEEEREAVEGLDETITWMNAAKNYIAQLEEGAKKDNLNLSHVAPTDDRFRLTITKSLTTVTSALSNMKRSLRVLGPWCAYQTACMVKKDMELMLKHGCFHKEMTTPILGAISQVHMFGTLLEIHYKVHKINAGDVEGVLRLSSPKIRKLMDVLRQNKPESGDTSPLAGLRCIIFVAARFDAWALHKFFEFVTAKPNGEFRFLKSGHLVGQLTPDGSEFPIPYRVNLSYKQSCATLEKFRRGEINLLLSTNVVEEGLDVPHCNLIIRFDKPPHYCSHLQSRARARAENSKYIVLAPEEDSAKVRKDLDAFAGMDEIIRRTCVERNLPAMADQEMHFQDKPSDSYSPPGCKASVTLSSALSFLQRYTNTLMDDRSSSNVIRGQFLDTQPGQYVYRIYMSLSSAIKRPVTGSRPMPTQKLAKQAAALECIRLLHQLGELNDNLLPNAQEQLRDMKKILGLDFQREAGEEGGSIPGTKKRPQYYTKQSAALLSNCRPVSNEPLFLYTITTTFIRSFQDEPAARFIADQSRAIGLLSRTCIPALPPFDVFIYKAEYRVALTLVNSDTFLTEQQLDDVQTFHTNVYEQVIRFSEAIALSFKPDVADGAIYTVPLTRSSEQSSWDIDWDVMARVKEPSQYSVVSQPDEARKRMKITPDRYRDGVVTRWYKTDDDRFFVLNVREDFTPSTPSPIDEFSSFAEYFERKYGIEIQQLHQPMLTTKYCSREMNLLRRPIYKEDAASKTSKLTIQRDKSLMLVPELCQLFPFPASLYSKCLVLPSVMYRLNTFCQVLDLRRQIQRQTGIGSTVQDPINWPPLIYSPKLTPATGTDSNNEAVDCETELSFPKSQTAESEPIHVPGPSTALEDSAIPLNGELPDNFEPGLVYASYEREKFYWIEGSNKRKQLTESAGESKRLISGRRKPDASEGKVPKVTECGCAPHLSDPPFLLDAEFNVDATTAPLPDVCQLLNALVTAKASDGFNLERLEVIGESFLKLTSYIHMFFRFPQHQEGRLTQLCDQQVSNYNLYRLAKLKGLQRYVVNQAFEPVETFVPPGFVFDEEESNAVLANSGTKAEKFPSPRIHQAIEDKTIADVVEAMIGTFLINSSARSAQLFMSWIGLHVLPELPGPEEERTTAERYGRFDVTSIPTPMLRNDSDTELVLKRLTAGFDDFENRIGYKFHNRAYLLQAFTHRSYDPNDITDCYQRLEYLGDAVIDFLITRYVYEDEKSFNSGMMLDMRSALVNNRTFSTLAVKYNYHSHIKFRNLRLYNHIEEFVQEVQEKDQDVLTLEADMMCTNFDDEKDTEEEGFEEADAPKVLGDVFESVAGAIFVDSGLSLDVVWRVYYNIMRPQIEYVVKHCPKNPIRELMELEGPNCRFGPGEPLGNGRWSVQVTILGRDTYIGKGNNIRAAKTNASKAALEGLRKTQR
ncbi:Endoribonuclease Dicer [Hypsibius exemplaris]|uniref:Endoribonuclease Dicer n=1 Tax=Hypsibius exemplaris TaxID=2072580 RepID=A0A9X6RLJ3_HYPEX|nr:Endoribonuclease Dicer [Hypsibius exemplaris]